MAQELHLQVPRDRESPLGRTRGSQEEELRQRRTTEKDDTVGGGNCGRRLMLRKNGEELCHSRTIEMSKKKTMLRRRKIRCRLLRRGNNIERTEKRKTN